MLQNGYTESAEEEANKRTVLNRRTYSKPSGTQEKILSFQNGLLLETIQYWNNIGIHYNFLTERMGFGISLVYHSFDNPTWYFDGSFLQYYVQQVTVQQNTM